MVGRAIYPLEAPADLVVVVVAYDFPPNPSPQSLRTGKLVEGLLKAGFRVSVLTRKPRSTWSSGFERHQQSPIDVIHCEDEPIDALVERLRKWRRVLSWQALEEARNPSTGGPSALQLNWKGRLVALAKRATSGLLYPGESRWWLRKARPELKHLLNGLRPDCVVISHEPAAGLMLHDECAKAGTPLVADLGDPVCAVYTPRRWRRRAFSLEASICARARRVTVSCEAAKTLLRRRHGVDADKIVVLTQGFPEAIQRRREDGRHGQALRLVYTGRFYPFRSPANILLAMDGNPSVEFRVATTPGNIAGVRDNLPANVRILGELPHDEALDEQASADVLVNIANEGLPQIPGKFFEYMGVPRPILHITHDETDEQAIILRSLRRGWVVRNDAREIKKMLDELAIRHRQGILHDGLDLSQASVDRYRWPRIGASFAGIVEEVAKSAHVVGRGPGAQAAEAHT